MLNRNSFLYEYRKDNNESTCQENHDGVPYLPQVFNDDTTLVSQTLGTSLPSTPQGVEKGYFSYGFTKNDKYLIPQGPNEYSLGYKNPLEKRRTSHYSHMQNKVYYNNSSTDLYHYIYHIKLTFTICNVSFVSLILENLCTTSEKNRQRKFA